MINPYKHWFRTHPPDIVSAVVGPIPYSSCRAEMTADRDRYGRARRAIHHDTPGNGFSTAGLGGGAGSDGFLSPGLGSSLPQARECKPRSSSSGAQNAREETVLHPE